MAFCEKCGAHLDEEAGFCPACGATRTAAASPSDVPEPSEELPPQPMQPADPLPDPPAAIPEEKLADFTEAEIREGRAMAVLAYLGPLVLIPLLAAKEARFAQYHANQGLVLLLIGIAGSIIALIPLLGWLLGFVIGLFTCVLCIMGILNVAQGKARSLPLIGKFRLLP